MIARSSRTEHAGRVAVVIPHAGRADLLHQCLATFCADPEVDEVCVVLPSEAADSLTVVERYHKVSPVVTDQLTPYGEAANIGLARTSAPFVLLLNDDTALTGGALSSLARVLDAELKCAAIVPRLVNPDGSLQPSLYDEPGLRSIAEMFVQPLVNRIPSAAFSHPRQSFPDRISECNWASGAAILLRRSVVERVGGLDEAFRHGMEDAALCRVMRDAGFSILASPAVEVTHIGGSSGFRCADPSRVARTLRDGTTGWFRYLTVYAERPGAAKAARVLFIVFGVTRLIGYLTLGLFLRRPRTRVTAYRQYLRWLLTA